MNRFFVETENPTLLLSEIISELGICSMSIEGWILDKNIDIPDPDSCEETAVLKRNTISPELDFMIYIIDSSRLEAIIGLLQSLTPYLRDEQGVIHVQVECNGSLYFGAYDNFDPECIIVNAPLKRIEFLLAKGLITNFRQVNTYQDTARESQKRWQKAANTFVSPELGVKMLKF